MMYIIALVIALIVLAIAILLISLAVGLVIAFFYGIYSAFKNCAQAIYDSIDNTFMRITLNIVLILCGLAVLGGFAFLTVFLISLCL